MVRKKLVNSVLGNRFPSALYCGLLVCFLYENSPKKEAEGWRGDRATVPTLPTECPIPVSCSHDLSCRLCGWPAAGAGPLTMIPPQGRARNSGPGVLRHR